MGFLRKDQLHLCHSGKSLQHTVSQNVSKNKRFVQLLVLGFFFGHVTWHMGSSPTRNQIHAPSIRSSESNHWTLAKSPVKLPDCPCFLGAQAQRGPDPDTLAVLIFPRGTHVPWAQPSRGAQHCPEPTAAPAGGREWVSTQV